MKRKKVAAKQYKDNHIFYLCWNHNLNRHYFLMMPNPMYSMMAYKVQ